MNSILTFVLVSILFILLFWFCAPKTRKLSLAPEPVPLKDDKPIDYEVDWDKLTEGERVQYIVDTYFNVVPTTAEAAQTAQEAADTAFVAALPQDDTTCSDEFDQCAVWADDGECTINPEFMLYSCAKSCKVCSLSKDDKERLDRIYNNTPQAHCVYHGEDYPGKFKYLNRLYDYTVAVNY